MAAIIEGVTRKMLAYILKAPLRWFRKLYDWTIHLSKSKHAPRALFGVAFIESSFFPIPPDVLLLTMVLADRKKWAWYALVCTAGSVWGSLFGYFIGWGFYETIGKLIIDTYHLNAAVDFVGQRYAENAFLAVFTAAFTPIPYKVFTIAAGLFRISIPTLIVASIIGRSGRFFLVAGILRIFGKKIADSIEKYFDIFSLVFVALLIGGFVLFKYMGK